MENSLSFACCSCFWGRLKSKFKARTRLPFALQSNLHWEHAMNSVSVSVSVCFCFLFVIIGIWHCACSTLICSKLLSLKYLYTHIHTHTCTPRHLQCVCVCGAHASGHLGKFWLNWVKLGLWWRDKFRLGLRRWCDCDSADANPAETDKPTVGKGLLSLIQISIKFVCESVCPFPLLDSNYSTVLLPRLNLKGTSSSTWIRLVPANITSMCNNRQQ